jgi:hypothetical protein
MPLLECSRKIIAEVERLSGCPVHVMEDASLTVLARIRIARGNVPVHILAYKPGSNVRPDYFIAYQCGFVIRLFQTPPEQRLDLAPAGEGARQVASLMPDAPQQLQDHLLEGLGLQLRSVPAGMRIDGWIAGSYPELKELQEDAARRQVAEGLCVLRPEVRRSAPAKVYDANAALNAASALFWSRLLADDEIVIPYKMAGLLDRGRRLLDIFDEAGANPADDCGLVDAWASELGLKGWYGWVPFDAGAA